ncbi:MAG TPA: amino acid permease [Chitinophagaceae bacterium]
MADHPSNFKPTLGLLDATMIVAGSMIGSGIFIVSADMLKDVGSAGWLIFAWLLTGFLTLTAAVSYGELSGMYPKAGGQYVYLKEAYNPLIGFLYGWSFFAVIQTGTIAAVGVAFSRYTAYLIPALSEKNIIADLGFLKISAAQICSIIVIIFLTYINTRGIKSGKWIQNIFTGTKLFSLFGLIIAGFFVFNPDVWHSNWVDGWHMMQHSSRTDAAINPPVWQTLTGFAIIGALTSALVGSIFSSDAWNNVTFIAGEIKNPKKNIGLSLFLGTLIVTIIYVLCNLRYLSVLSNHEIAFAPEGRPAIAASEKIFGSYGAYIIAIMIMISTFGCNNGLILSGARVYYTMAKDRLFFKKTAELNKQAVPGFALWIQCVWTSLLCLSGTYGQLLTYVVFVVLIFYVLTLIGIIVLRKKQPHTERPYRAIGYPALIILYCVIALIICIGLFVYQPKQTWPGLVIVLLGIPLYYIAVANKKPGSLNLSEEETLKEDV